MKWNLIRKQYRHDGIFGEMVSEDGKVFLFTLERAYEIDGKFKPKIPSGLHLVKPYNSPKHQRIVPQLSNKEDEGHNYQFHIGNYNSDSQGCILVGMGMGHRQNKDYMLVSSGNALEKLIEHGITEVMINDT